MRAEREVPSASDPISKDDPFLAQKRNCLNVHTE